MGNTVPVEDCESVDTAIDTVLPSTPSPAFVVHPNPATVDFRVDWRVGDIPVSALLYVYDLNGKIVAQSPHNATVSVRHLPRGIYYIKIDGFNQVQKLAIF
ncbi:MAG: T9SS type A sorting domain-containing protein [Sphingobacteriales bacterium]|nr:T9SS type A sorting domain-containing protein [Sphingobacteriales bacterium]